MMLVKLVSRFESRNEIVSLEFGRESAKSKTFGHNEGKGSHGGGNR